jgi:hypothetical protein
MGNLRRQFAALLDARNRLARQMHDTLIQGCVGLSTLFDSRSALQRDTTWLAPASVGAASLRAR